MPQRGRARVLELPIINYLPIYSSALDHTPDPDTDVVDFVQGGPTRTSRALAMTQIAVFDALNSFVLTYGAFNDIGASDSTRASTDAAVAYAAHGIMTKLYPDQSERLDAVLSSDLEQIDARDTLIEGGQVVEVSAAQAMVSARASDNSFDFKLDSHKQKRWLELLSNDYSRRAENYCIVV